MLVFNCAVCLGLFGWQLVFKILEHLPYIVVNTYKIVQLFFQKPNDLGFENTEGNKTNKSVYDRLDIS